MKESQTSQHVLAFAEEMEAKLAKNRHKGDRDGWMSTTPEVIFARLVEEVGEVAQIMASGGPVVAMRGELADVANFCMMLSDHYSD